MCFTELQLILDWMNNNVAPSLLTQEEMIPSCFLAQKWLELLKMSCKWTHLHLLYSATPSGAVRLQLKCRIMAVVGVVLFLTPTVWSAL